MRYQDKQAEVNFFINYSYIDSGNIEYVISQLRPNAIRIEGNILEAGCGNGHNGKVFLATYPDITVKGVDLIYGQDIENSELFNDDSFNVILSICFLHHLPNVRRTLDNFYWWLKHGGIVIILEPNGYNPILILSYWLRRLLELFIKNNIFSTTPNETLHTIGKYLKKERLKPILVKFDFLDSPGNDIRIRLNRLFWKLMPGKLSANNVMLILKKGVT